jgi:hypothetical protein
MPSQPTLRNLNSLLEVSKAMASAIDLDAVLAVIQSRATEVMEAERGSIFVQDERSGTLGSLAAVQQFVGDRPPSDDITAMGVRYVGR